MFEKAVITTLKSGAAVIYVIIMLVLFSAPVLFIWQAFVPPVFTFDSMSAPEIVENEEFISDDGGKWYRIDYSVTASSGKISPYSFEIEQFEAVENEYLGSFSDHRVEIDEPLKFSNTEDDSFILSLYIRSETAPDLEEVAENVSFKAVNYKKSFGQFYVTFEKREEETTIAA